MLLANGSWLAYLSVTHSDLSHVVGMVSKFMDAPRSIYYAAILQFLRYVKGTLYHGLHFIMLIQMRTGQVIRLIDTPS